MPASEPSQSASFANVRYATRIAGVAGLALFTGLIAYQGVRDVAALLATAGVGLVVITVFHLSTLVLHAVAWRSLLVGASQRGMTTLLWARWIAEAINDLLPVAQLGGNVARAMLLRRTGVAGGLAVGTVIVDVTTNFFAQLIFTVLGLSMLSVIGHHRAPALSIAVGVGIMAASAVGFLVAQRRGMFTFLAQRIEKISWTPEMKALSSGAVSLDRAIDDLYRNRRAISAATAWHLASWLVGVVEIWIALHYLTQPLPLLAVLLLEALTEAVRSAAFIVPGAIGVQEGGYILVGAWLGLTPDVALAVSLTKRVREVVLGVPGLVAWQLQGAATLWDGRGEAKEGR